MSVEKIKQAMTADAAAYQPSAQWRERVLSLSQHRQVGSTPFPMRGAAMAASVFFAAFIFFTMASDGGISVVDAFFNPADTIVATLDSF